MELNELNFNINEELKSIIEKNMIFQYDDHLGEVMISGVDVKEQLDEYLNGSPIEDLENILKVQPFIIKVNHCDPESGYALNSVYKYTISSIEEFEDFLNEFF